jgi:alkanesulfonate monooxygenase SsuD/methylene tetrahydromethanopterin reductase-like flavin-dependent oxidoreductase (luciferase family)
MTALGAVFLPDLPPERLRAVAEAADRAGLEQLWLWEDCFRTGGIATAAAVLGWTERLQVGIGLLPVPLRNPALTAMEAATLARLFPGRLHLTVGHGVQEWMGQVGARVESPLTLLREYAGALRALLAGEEVTTQGRYVRLDRIRLVHPPREPVPLLAGAVGPRSLRLSGEVADGTVLVHGTTPDDLRRAKEAVDEGRAAAERSGPHPLVVNLLTATGDGADARLDRSLRDWGLEPVPDAGVAGGAEEVAAAVRRLVDAGATSVTLQPTGVDVDPVDFVAFVAQQVQPLTR